MKKKMTIRISQISTIGFLLILMNSCKDEVNDKTPEELLLGRWEMVSEEYTEYIYGMIRSRNIRNYEVNQFVIEILLNGEGKFYSYGALEGSILWEIDVDSIILNISGVGLRKGIFTVNENELIFTLTIKYMINDDAVTRVTNEIYKRD
jgi:hypothetical protein